MRRFAGWALLFLALMLLGADLLAAMRAGQARLLTAADYAQALGWAAPGGWAGAAPLSPWPLLAAIALLWPRRGGQAGRRRRRR